MEELFADNRLTDLEEKIDALLDAYKRVREERENLAARVEALEAEGMTLKERLATAESERDMVMRKIKGILEKIEQIEA